MFTIERNDCLVGVKYMFGYLICGYSHSIKISVDCWTALISFSNTLILASEFVSYLVTYPTVSGGVCRGLTPQPHLNKFFISRQVRKMSLSTKNASEALRFYVFFFFIKDNCLKNLIFCINYN